MQTSPKLFWSSNIFGSSEDAGESPAQHAVIVHFSYPPDHALPVFRLERRLSAAIAAAGVGEYDGFTVEGGKGSLFMYGPDADRLFAVVRPVLERYAFMQGARVDLRRGPPQQGVCRNQLLLGAQTSGTDAD